MFARLACGKVEVCPLGQGLDQLREKVYVLFESAGEDPRKRATDLTSPLEFWLGRLSCHKQEIQNVPQLISPTGFEWVSASSCLEFHPFTNENGSGN